MLRNSESAAGQYIALYEKIYITVMGMQATFKLTLKIDVHLKWAYSAHFPLLNFLPSLSVLCMLSSLS